MKMNNIDKQYTDLLKDILENGTRKTDRTGTGTISVFGRQLRHDFRDGFPLLTTKRMPFKTIVTELLWFLRGDTNIKFLVDNGCHIWDGDAYKRYTNYPLAEMADGGKNLLYQNLDKGWCVLTGRSIIYPHPTRHLTKEEFINKIKTDDEFAEKWGELGPIYGKQWRKWNNGYDFTDQIANLINDLKTNPDSRRLMVNAWNVGELDQMVLPPCHYGFQVYTRELSLDERKQIFEDRGYVCDVWPFNGDWNGEYDGFGIPRRAISLMWNQRSVDTPLGLPFNIASYGLLLEIIAKMVNMVPDELIGNLGDCHIYLNQIDGVKEQIGRELSLEERLQIADKINKEIRQDLYSYAFNNPIYTGGIDQRPDDVERHEFLTDLNIPKRTREPFPLPTLKIDKTYDWGKESVDISEIHPAQILLEGYQSHPTIKFPLSN